MMQVREPPPPAARRRARARACADRRDPRQGPGPPLRHRRRARGRRRGRPARRRRCRSRASPCRGARSRGPWRSTRPVRRCTRPAPHPRARPGRSSVPAPSMSPISSPGMTPARPPIPRRTRSRARPSRSRPGPSLWHRRRAAPAARARTGSDASTPRPVAAHHAPTEPLRIPPARGPGRGLLLVLFVLLTLAAVALGVFLLRGGLSDLTGAAAASAVAVARFAGSSASAPPDTVRNRHR